MRDWFKYEFGYVNIDNENIYFTNSGNWSEIVDLPEKTLKVQNQNKSKKNSVIFFLILTFLFFAVMITKNILSGKVALTLMFLTIFGGYKLYEYLRTEIGAKFRIPLKQVIEIQAENASIEIIFMNAEDEKDSHKITGVTEQGVTLMQSLKRELQLQ